MLRRIRLTPIASFVLPILAASLLSLWGCGYRPLPFSAGNPSDGRASPGTLGVPTRLAVMAIRNDSPEPWLDRILTDALRREMEARGALRLVNDPADADLVLRGHVRPLHTRSKSFSSFVLALEYSVTLELDLEVVRASGDIVRLDSEMLSETDVYLASADIEVTRTHKLEALRRLSDILASRIADTIELMERPIEVPEDGA
ncbi:MAG: LPS assembly lipoprotein LptE [Myxococcota bacterium]